MPRFTDSLGNVYSSLPERKANPSAKPTRTKLSKPRLKKGGRNEKKYSAYRTRKGRPNGPGVPGNKAGKNKR